MLGQSKQSNSACNPHIPNIPPRIGLLIGREISFPKALIKRVQKLSPTTQIDFLKIDLDVIITNELPSANPSNPTAEIDLSNCSDYPWCPYKVILDRISHDVECYQPYLKAAALQGTIVLNDPFFRHMDDKFFDTALAARLGIAVPKTVLLPSKMYGRDVSAASLRNLEFPLGWEPMVKRLGFPMYLKSHTGQGWFDVYRVSSIDELWETYDRTGTLTMIAQEEIKWVQFVRCIVIGDEIYPAEWDPRLPHHERYTRAVENMPPLSDEQLSKICDSAMRISRALGYEMNTIEFAISEDGVPYAIDLMNSVPDFDIKSLGQHLFWWVVDRMAKLLIRYAHSDYSVPYLPFHHQPFP
ncbi:hypothetical protein HK096_002264, partial [Nowakowskiella sp. JEL0078]